MSLHHNMEENSSNSYQQPLLLANYNELDVSILERTWVESKKIWKIAGPSSFSRLSLYSLAVITQSFAGHLSDTDLAAISIATTVITSITFGFLVIHIYFDGV